MSSADEYFVVRNVATGGEARADDDAAALELVGPPLVSAGEKWVVVRVMRRGSGTRSSMFHRGIGPVSEWPSGPFNPPIEGATLAEVQRRYAELSTFELNYWWPTAGLSPETIEEIERKLGLSLPADVIDILAFYSGFELGRHMHLSWDPSARENVVDQTLEMRTWDEGLDHRYVVLGIDPPAVYELDTSTGRVYDAALGQALFDLAQLEDDDDHLIIYGSYTDFLSRMIDEGYEKHERYEQLKRLGDQ